ncbi:hypothetical protein LEMLEM_LOCUS26400 [Lemmus lemmus]
MRRSSKFCSTLCATDHTLTRGLKQYVYPNIYWNFRAERQMSQVEGNHAVWWKLRSRPGERFGWEDRESPYSSLGG